MCCRYYFDDETMENIQKVVDDVDKKINWRNPGEVFPSESALVITGNDRQNQTLAQNMKWGLSTSYSKGLLINARAETAQAKRTFSDSVGRRRCIIPAKCFYEWDAHKTKTTFSMNEEPVLFMAGIYTPCEDGNHFVILTTEANDSMRPIHDRMPLIFTGEDWKNWLMDSKKTGELLRKGSPELKRYQEYEQLSFNF